MLHPETSLVASIPSPPLSWASVPIGPLSIKTYALCILAAIVVAWLVTRRRLVARGGEPGIELDVLIVSVPLGIIGARLYHVVTHPHDFFAPGVPWWQFLAIWQGGDALFGALIGGTIGAIIGCRWAGIRIWSFADALAPGLLLAQAVGRLGNYVNHELFGLPTTGWWGLQIESSNLAFPAGLPDGTLFQPLFLIEMILNVIGVIVLLALERRLPLRWGRLFALYLMWYGLVRAYLETIRIDPTEFDVAGVPSNVLAALAAVLLGLVILIVQTRRHPAQEPSVYRPGREWVRPDPAVDSDDSEDGEAAAARVDDDREPVAASSPRGAATSD